MPALKVTIVQADLCWHDAAKNRDAFEQRISGIAEPTDLIVLPEMFTTGFSMNAAQLAETMDGESVSWMRAMAADANAAICGSLIIADAENYYNRFVCIAADGRQTIYDKRHLFRLADEQHHYAPGQDLVTFDLKGFRVRPMICYDLRFPAWSRDRGDYDVLLYVANWPGRRHHAWQTLLPARAIENLCYTIGVNRVGTDGNDVPYAGGSTIIDYLGQELAGLGEQQGMLTATLDLEALQKFRQRFAFHKDADDFHLPA